MEPPIENLKVVVNNKEVSLDPKNMEFSDNTINEYMEKEYGWVDFFGKQLEYAQKERLLAEIDAEAIFSQKYIEAKDDGGTEQYAKAKANANPDVIAAKKKVVELNETVGQIKAHLKAWDRNHDNAQNRGYTLRKEMDKLNKDIYKMTETSDLDRFVSEA
jgi:hypothetical protein